MPKTESKSNKEPEATVFKSGFISVIGRPNTGKSTLVNRLVGEKIAIVSEKPQTTRTRIMGIVTTDRYQMIFLDTPGIHAPRHKLGEVMVEVAKRTIPDADVLLFLVDGSEPLKDEDREIARLLQGVEVPIILAVNKSDKYAPGAELSAVDEVAKSARVTRWVSISAATGQGIEELMTALEELLPEGPRYYPEDQITDQQERVIAAELIREQVLHHTRQEVPHAVAVLVDEYKERSEGTIYIHATIYIEKESQKHIIIGRGGEMLKKIGQDARRQIENMTGEKVFLELWVKLRKDWRKKEPSLRDMGYQM